MPIGVTVKIDGRNIKPEELSKLMTDVFDPSLLDGPIAEGMNDGLKVVKKEFEKTTATWDTKPTFNIDEAQRVGTSLIGSVWTDDENYGRVNDGTPSRTITPKNPAGVLTFRRSRGYVPKTAPLSITSIPSANVGDWVSVKQVTNHSIKARNFDKAIADKVTREDIFSDRVLKRLDDFIK